MDKEFPEDPVPREPLVKKVRREKVDYLVCLDSKVLVDIPVCQVPKDNVAKVDYLELDL